MCWLQFLWPANRVAFQMLWKINWTELTILDGSIRFKLTSANLTNDTSRLIFSPATLPSTNCYHPRLRFELLFSHMARYKCRLLTYLLTYLLLLTWQCKCRLTVVGVVKAGDGFRHNVVDVAGTDRRVVACRSPVVRQVVDRLPRAFDRVNDPLLQVGTHPTQALTQLCTHISLHVWPASQTCDNNWN